MAAERINITLPPQTLQGLDLLRGDVPRSRCIARLIERALREQTVPRLPEPVEVTTEGGAAA
jgi:hypothetical protein